MRTLQVTTIEGEEHELLVDGAMVDNDGTIVDTEKVIVEARSRAFENHGFRVPPSELLHGRHDDDVRRIALEHQEDGLRPVLDELWGRVCGAFADLSVAHLRGEVGELQLFEDVFDTNIWEHLRVTIVTNAAEFWYNSFVANPAFGDFYRSFPVTMPVMDGIKVCQPKPAPDLLLHAQKEHGFSRPVMIGDTHHDVAAARAANVPVIHIHRGSDPLHSNPSDRIYVARGFGDIQVRN